MNVGGHHSHRFQNAGQGHPLGHILLAILLVSFGLPVVIRFWPSPHRRNMTGRRILLTLVAAAIVGVFVWTLSGGRQPG